MYRRVMDDIEARIDEGVLRPRDKLPTLSELARAYRCSVQPVKLALRLLQHAGVLVGHQGRGVYVAERLNRPLHPTR